MLGNVLQLVISAQISKELSEKELQAVLKSYKVLEQALADFNQGLLTWEEYLDLLEMHQVNIDSYLNIVDHNLKVIGIN